MKYEIEEQLLQAVLNYLTAHPYREVYQLIQAISQSKTIGEKNVEKSASTTECKREIPSAAKTGKAPSKNAGTKDVADNEGTDKRA